MSEEPTARSEALLGLLKRSREELDPADLSPLYVELRSLQQRYSEPELLAVGGMKRILKVRDRRSNRYVAMARLHEDASDLLFDPFIREARLTALLEHPNIISVHDVGVDEDGQPFFTMELKVGDGLDVILSKERVGKAYPLAERLEIFLKVCDAITYAHSRQVIHLDLKPANIQVGKFGEVLVCDWGLGKLIGDNEAIDDHVLLNPDLLSEMTLSGKVRGTPGYMAPEQISGEERDTRTDVYALGALLYALLTRRAPFEGDTETIMDATLEGSLAPPALRNPDVPESLSAVVMKAMALAPADRYDSVTTLAKDIRAFIGGFSPAAYESNLRNEVALFYHRHRAVCNVAAVFLAVVVGVTALFVDRLSAKRAQAEELAARLQEEKQESEALLREVGELATPFRTDLNDSAMLGFGGQVNKDFFFQAPIVAYKLSRHSLNEVIRTQPENRDEALGLLGYLHVVAAEFDKARPYLKADPDRLSKLADLNDEFVAGFDPVAHEQSATQLAWAMDLVLKRMNRRYLAERMLAYDYASLGYRKDYHLAVAAIYRHAGVRMSYDLESLTATLRGAGPERSKTVATYSGLTPIRFLPVRQLIVRNMIAEDIRELDGLSSLEVLDLRGSLLDQALNPKTFPRLRKVILRPGQWSDAEIAKLPPQVEVALRELEPTESEP